VAAIWATRVLVALAPLALPRREGIVVDWRIAAVVTGVGALLGLLAATAPAIWSARANLSSLLASSAVRGGGGHARMRRSLVVAQVALSLILLSSSHGALRTSFAPIRVSSPRACSRFACRCRGSCSRNPRPRTRRRRASKTRWPPYRE
jgi:hypothetical protein